MNEDLEIGWEPDYFDILAYKGLGAKKLYFTSKLLTSMYNDAFLIGFLLSNKICILHQILPNKL